MPAALPAWNIFKQIFAEHWDGFKCVHPRYNTRYYDGLVDKMLGCGDPEKMGYIEFLSCSRSMLERHGDACRKPVPEDCLRFTSA
jgi:hypothetical protein